jgi:hypothetical protein
MRIPTAVALVLILVGGGAVRAAQQPESTKPALLISATPTKEIVKAGSDVSIKVTLKNTSNRKLLLGKDGMDRPERDYTIDVTDDQGNIPPLTDYGRAVIKHEGVVIGRPSSITLQSGEVRTEEVPLSSLFDFSKGGKYKIELSR